MAVNSTAGWLAIVILSFVSVSPKLLVTNNGILAWGQNVFIWKLIGKIFGALYAPSHRLCKCSYKRSSFYCVHNALHKEYMCIHLWTWIDFWLYVSTLKWIVRANWLFFIACSSKKWLHANVLSASRIRCGRFDWSPLKIEPIVFRDHSFHVLLHSPSVFPQSSWIFSRPLLTNSRLLIAWVQYHSWNVGYFSSRRVFRRYYHWHVFIDSRFLISYCQVCNIDCIVPFQVLIVYRLAQTSVHKPEN